jgi:putative ABC transport system substrate-binding protein
MLAFGAEPVLAQTANHVYRLGHLADSPVSEKLTRDLALPELARLGFVEGRNLIFDSRVAARVDALPGLMRELLAAQPDAVVAVGPAAIAAAGAGTRTVPVISFGNDPVEMGLAKSHAHPGTNVTGVAILANQLEGKRLSILREAVPGRRRVAALLSKTGNPVSEPSLKKAALGLGVDLLPFTVAGPPDYKAAFAAMRAAGAEALVIAATSEFNRDAEQLARLALEAKLPTVCEWADMARQGCMLGYGPNRLALRKRLAALVATIFRGTAPGEVAIELPVVFDFAVNQKIARALDVSIPLTVLADANEVIE